MKNLEIKVKLNSQKDVDGLLDFADRKEVLNQKDTYFLVGDKRLKIREEKKSDELIYYIRKNEKNSKESDYFVFPVYYKLTPFVKKVLGFMFGEKIVVIKKRNLFIYKNTRIHLDEVSNLGDFLELETVINNSFDYKYFLDQHEEVKDKLDLSKYESLPNSYSDFMLLHK
ncbi:MAG: class IV adenylate cyclase [Candidatus Nomurabacteria bacterium]